jgi:hypothetical protein
MAACLAVWVSGCSSGGQMCSVADYGVAGQGHFTSPRQALRSVLARHPQWLSTSGWVVAGHSTREVTFRSGNDSVDTVRVHGGRWNVGGVTACR